MTILDTNFFNLLTWVLGGVGGFILLLMRTTIQQMQKQIDQLTAQVANQAKEVSEWQTQYRECHEAQVLAMAENGRLRHKLDILKAALLEVVPQSKRLLEDTNGD